MYDEHNMFLEIQILKGNQRIYLLTVNYLNTSID